MSMINNALSQFTQMLSFNSGTEGSSHNEKAGSPSSSTVNPGNILSAKPKASNDEARLACLKLQGMGTIASTLC